MTTSTDNSSLPLLLSITGAIVAVAGGGWFVLYNETPDTMPAPAASVEPLVAVADEDAPEAIAGDATPAAVAETGVAESEAADAGTETVTVVERAAGPDLDAELRKARLAADADVLVLPDGSSALYYYGRVLAAEPDNDVASAELDAVLARVQQTVTAQLADEDFDSAYRTASMVARYRPEHELVRRTLEVLDRRTEVLIGEALTSVRAGDYGAAETAVETAESLPGRNPDYFVAVRDSLAEIREARDIAEADRQRRARLADDEARAAWVANVRSAIAAGQLIAPAGASARDLLAEDNAWTAERETLESEFVAALVAAVEASIEGGEPQAGERLMRAAIDAGGEAEALARLQQALEEALIEAESNRLVDVRELVLVEAVPPVYPRRAVLREVSGWVELEFFVTPEGRTADIRVRNSEPSSIFDKAAIRAVEEWVLEPVEYRGRLIEKRVGARLAFQFE